MSPSGRASKFRIGLFVIVRFGVSRGRAAPWCGAIRSQGGPRPCGRLLRRPECSAHQDARRSGAHGSLGVLAGRARAGACAASGAPRSSTDRKPHTLLRYASRGQTPGLRGRRQNVRGLVGLRLDRKNGDVVITASDACDLWSIYVVWRQCTTCDLRPPCAGSAAGAGQKPRFASGAPHVFRSVQRTLASPRRVRLPSRSLPAARPQMLG